MWYGDLNHAPFAWAFAPSTTSCIWRKGRWIRPSKASGAGSRSIKETSPRFSRVQPRCCPGDLLRFDREKRTVTRTLQRLENRICAEVDSSARKCLHTGSTGGKCKHLIRMQQT